MNKATLVIMAAGMGSRYGGLKQIDPIGPGGETILDYSIYDAVKAGFDKVVFVIKEEIEKDFKEIIGNKFDGVVDRISIIFPRALPYPKEESSPGVQVTLFFPARV